MEENDDEAWRPNVSFGPLVFGNPIQQYLDSGVLVRNGENYNHGEVTVFAEEGRIQSILVTDCFFYKKTNLIGLSETEAVALINLDPVLGIGVEYDDGSVEYPVEYTDDGLILWVDSDVVVSCTVYNANGD